MKLLYCTKCRDVFSLDVDAVTKCCACGATQGRYLPDGLNAEYEGPGVPLGFDNTSFAEALSLVPFNRPARFQAFIIEDKCPTFRKKEAKA